MVLLAPLFGAGVWLVRFAIKATAYELPPLPLSEWVGLLGIAYLYAFVVTLVIGVPIGFLAVLLLRKSGLERRWAHPIAGALLGFIVGWPLGMNGEFALSGAAVGLCLGLGYGQFVYQPRTLAGEQG